MELCPYHASQIRSVAKRQCILLLLTGILFLTGCGPSNAEKELSEAALMLVDPAPEIAAEVLPHTVDFATEFKAALETVAADVEKPNVREAPLEPVAVIGAERRATGLSAVFRTEPEKAPERSVVLVPPASNEIRSWGSVILVPDINKMSRAFTSDVRLERIEAHPLSDNRLRVWVRVRNISSSPREIGVALDFRTRARASESTEFVHIQLAAGDVVDAHFLSPEPWVLAYTILAK